MEIFGGYKLLSKLGEGGMGAVYKAEELLTHRTVALKVLRKDLAASTMAEARFKREAQLAGLLNHKNVAACHSAGTVNGVRYLAMEFVDGETLMDRCKRTGGKLSESDALRIIGEVAQGLAHAHSKGVVHRDIKPANILLGADGSVKISDFGTAKSFADDAALSVKGTIIGTPYYISPEQVRAEPADHRSDLYSLGGTFYFAVTGRTPFSGNTTTEIMRRHLEEELENPGDINPDLSPGTVSIIAKLMAKVPDERYQSAQDAADDILRVMHKEEPLCAEMGEESQSSVRPARRRSIRRRRVRVKSNPGCAGMLLLACALLLLFW